MKNMLAKVLILFVCLISLIACSDATDKEISSGSKGVFYQIDHEDTTVYLFGSVHFGNEDMYPLHDAVEEAYAQSNIVGVEVDILNLDFMEIQNFYLEHGIYHDGSTLKNYLDDELYNDIIAVFSEKGVPEEAIAPLKPWAIINDLNSIIYSNWGYAPEFGLEDYFLSQAVEDEKEIISLETVTDQLSLFALLAEETQIKMLREVISEEEDGKVEFDQMISNWIDGDIENLAKLREIEEDWSEDYLEHHLALTDLRDEAMAEKIDTFLQDGKEDTYFIIVGSLHLVGENSIVNLLEQKGYELIIPYEK